MTYRDGRSDLVGLMLLSTALSSAPAIAQVETPRSSANLSVTNTDRVGRSDEDIIVTAQRREQRLIDVPVSITAVTGDELQARNADRLADLQYSVPGLSLIDSGPGTERTQLRGVSQFVGAPTVGTYLDELSINPQSSGGGFNIRTFDLERIEILRGPQPTLYGEGSIGGTIRYITANPDLTKPVLRAEGRLGFIKNGGTDYYGEGAVSVPIVRDTLGLRVSGVYERDGGYINEPAGTNQNYGTVWNIRGKLLFVPAPELRITVLGIHQRDRQNDRSFGFADLTDSSPLLERTRTDSDLGNLVVTYDLGFATLTSSTGYLARRAVAETDLSYFFTQLLGKPFINGTRSFGDFERFAQEGRIASSGKGPLSYVLGAVYNSDRSDSTSLTYNLTRDPVKPDIPASRTRSKALSVYGELGDRLGPATLTLGGRYFHDKREVEATGVPVGAAVFESFNPRINLALDMGHGLIYANAAKGFRSGGFNDPTIVPPAPYSYGPEKFWSYEVGAKQDLLNRQLSVEAAIYYSDWNDIQAVTPIGLMPIILGIANSGKASGWGGELSLSARPNRDFTFTGTFGYAGIEYKRASATHAPGDPLDGVPRFTTSASLDYHRQISDAVTLRARGDLGFTSGARITTRNFAIQTTGDPAVGVIPSRVLINGRLGVDLKSIELYGYVRNLLNDTNGTFSGATILNERPIRPEPRVLGVGAAVNF